MARRHARAENSARARRGASSMRTLLLRGMLAGLLAGLCAFVFLKTLGESQVGRAIRVEGRIDDANGVTPMPEVISRNIQSTLGLATGTTVVGVALGGVFALAFAAAFGRVGSSDPRVAAVVLAACGFVVVHLVAFLKYPANPPSIGQPDTIGRRTALYFLMLAISVLVAVGTLLVERRIAPRFGTWNASIVAGIGMVVVLGVLYAVLPSVNEVPATFPASTLWRFRIASLGGQFVLWAVIGLVFGALTEAAQRPKRSTAVLQS